MGFENPPGVTNQNEVRPRDHQGLVMQLDRKFEAPCPYSIEAMKKTLLLPVLLLMTTGAFAVPAHHHKTKTTHHAKHHWTKKDTHKKPKM
ncbi:MAG: hypothetical protein ACP5M4_00760 [Acidobacteriaceae bacterium]